MSEAVAHPSKRAAYPAYKPSSVEWLGNVPAHWEVKRLKYTASINDEALPETTDPGYEFNYADIGNVDAVKGIVAQEAYMFENAPSRARRIVRDGDTIISTVRTYLRAIVPIHEPEDHLIVSTGFAVVRPHAIDPDYLSYALRSPYFVETVVSRSTGVSYPAINASEVGTIEIAIPTAQEQPAIAAFLDRETARIDALIEKKQRQIELLQEKRAALISHAVTMGLDPNAKMKDSGIEWLGQVPAHWSVHRAKVVFREVNERSETGDEELLTVSHITGVTRRSEKDVNMFMAETLENYKKCQAGDLVINTMWAWMGAMGTAREAGIVSPSYNVYRFRKDAHEPRYFDLLFRSRRFISEVICQSQGVWTSRLRLYPEAFFDIRIPCPPRDEQRAVVAEVDKQTGHFEALRQKIESSIATLREYRTALISAAVTGMIRCEPNVDKAKHVEG